MIFLFLTLRKYDIITCIAAVIFAALTVAYVKTGSETVVTNAIPVNTKVIVLDAGHGQPDGGAVGIAGTVEEGLNLDITLRLQKLLESSGAYVLLTRADENAAADDLDAKIKEIKRTDLKNRREFKEGEHCDAFVSIHMNKFADSRYKGAQVFYASAPDESRILGECLQDKLITLLDSSNNRVAKPAEKGIVILKESSVPSVIAECGFLSNAEEERLLSTDEYRDRVAYALFLGICDFFDKIK